MEQLFREIAGAEYDVMNADSLADYALGASLAMSDREPKRIMQDGSVRVTGERRRKRSGDSRSDNLPQLAPTFEAHNNMPTTLKELVYRPLATSEESGAEESKEEGNTDRLKARQGESTDGLQNKRDENEDNKSNQGEPSMEAEETSDCEMFTTSVCNMSLSMMKLTGTNMPEFSTIETDCSTTSGCSASETVLSAENVNRANRPIMTLAGGPPREDRPKPKSERGWTTMTEPPSTWYPSPIGKDPEPTSSSPA